MVENLLAAMLSLRVLALKFRYGESRPSEVHLLSVMRVSNRAPHLGYFAILYGDFSLF